MMRPSGPGRDVHLVAVLDRARQDHLRERVLQRALNEPLERPRAISRVVTLVAQPVQCLLVDIEHDLALIEQAFAGA